MSGLAHHHARLPRLDALRGIAILLVLLWHGYACVERSPVFSTVPLLDKIAGYGWMGVPLFFCLSGFLVVGILADYRHQPRIIQHFCVRRACRILPLYAVLLFSHLIALRFLPLQHHPDLAPLLHTPEPLWPYAVFLQNFAMIAHGDLGGHWLGVTWTLAIEIQFYLLAALLFCRVPAHSLPRVLLLLVCLGVVARHALFTQDSLPYVAGFLLLPARLDAFALGGLAALAVRTFEMTKNLRRAALVTVLGCALLYYLTFTHRFLGLQDNFRALGYLLVSLASACLVWLAAGAPALRVLHPLDFRPLAWFGATSYFLYLFHQPANYLTHYLMRDGPPRLLDVHDALLSALAFGLLICLAWLSRRYFESFFINLGRIATPSIPLRSAPASDRRASCIAP